jgi:hypothetical protein
MTCPRCGTDAAESQEYCLECGLRLPGRGRFKGVSLGERRLRLPLALTFAAAAAGAAVAIVAIRGGNAAPAPTVATGGSVTVTSRTAAPAFGTWPAGTDAWTIVLQSIPKKQGRDDAVAIAEAATQRKLPRVGILDSGRFASLHPGYWTVFTGVYETQPDATGALQQARAVVKTARVQHVSP